MPLRFHRVRSELAFDGWFGKDVCVVMLIQNIVGNMLNNCSCLFIIDQSCCFDDKFFRIELKLLEDSLLDTGQNRNNCLARQACFANEFANQVILYAAVGANLLPTIIS